jgi:hypothetical protein
MGCVHAKPSVSQQAVESGKTLLVSNPQSADEGQHQKEATTAGLAKSSHASDGQQNDNELTAGSSGTGDDNKAAEETTATGIANASDASKDQQKDNEQTTGGSSGIADDSKAAEDSVGASGAQASPSTSHEGENKNDESVKEKLHNVLLIVAGVLKGFAGVELPSLVNLSDEADTIYDKLESAFEHLKGKSISSIALAFADVAKALSPLVDVMQNIDSLKSESKRLATALAKMKSPTRLLFSVGKSLEVNDKEIQQLIDRAKQERQASEWNQYGTTIGAIVAEFVPEDGEIEPTPDEETDAALPVDEPGKNDPQKILAILHGMLSGFSDIVAPDMTAQIEDAYCVVSRLVAAVKNFEKKTLVATGQALEELALGLECLEKLLHSAGAIREDIDMLKKAVLQLRHPEAFVFIAVKNAGASLVLNGEEIGGHVEAAVKDFKAEHWTEFGSELGEVVGLLVKPVSKSVPWPWPLNTCCAANPKVAKGTSNA